MVHVASMSRGVRECLEMAGNKREQLQHAATRKFGLSGSKPLISRCRVRDLNSRPNGLQNRRELLISLGYFLRCRACVAWETYAALIASMAAMSARSFSMASNRWP